MPRSESSAEHSSSRPHHAKRDIRFLLCHPRTKHHPLTGKKPPSCSTPSMTALRPVLLSTLPWCADLLSSAGALRWPSSPSRSPDWQGHRLCGKAVDQQVWQERLSGPAWPCPALPTEAMSYAGIHTSCELRCIPTARPPCAVSFAL